MIEILPCGIVHALKSSPPGGFGRVRRRDVRAERIRRDVDVRLAAAPARKQRVRVRTARRLDHVDELRLRRVGDVEYADALVADARAADDRRVDRRAVLAGLCGVDRLEQERLAAHLVERDVVLRAVALVVRDHARLVPAGVEDAESAVVARVDEVAVEREVGVRDPVLVGVADQLKVIGAGHRSLLLGGRDLRAALRQLLGPLLAYVGLERYVQLACFIRMRPGKCRKCGERRSGRDQRGQALFHAPSQGSTWRRANSRPLTRVSLPSAHQLVRSPIRSTARLRRYGDGRSGCCRPAARVAAAAAARAAAAAGGGRRGRAARAAGWCCARNLVRML